MPSRRAQALYILPVIFKCGADAVTTFLVSSSFIAPQCIINNLAYQTTVVFTQVYFVQVLAVQASHRITFTSLRTTAWLHSHHRTVTK
jgi:hypothetical protein